MHPDTDLMDAPDPSYPRPLIVVVEAPIGVGKSTLLERVQARIGGSNPRVVFIPEPVQAWEEHGFLGAMYTGRISKIAFQMMVLVDLHAGLSAALSQYPPPAIIILERSVWGNRHTFAKINLTGDDMRLFDYAWSSLVDAPPLADLDVRFIHLRVDVDTVIERMRSRGRASEADVPRDYLQKLADAHEEWFATMSNPHVHIDARKPIEEVVEDACLVMTEWALQASERFHKEMVLFKLNTQRHLRARTLEFQASSEAAHDAAVLFDGAPSPSPSSPPKPRVARRVALTPTASRKRAIGAILLTLLLLVVTAATFVVGTAYAQARVAAAIF